MMSWQLFGLVDALIRRASAIARAAIAVAMFWFVVLCHLVTSFDQRFSV
jgi:hypothetical protein